MRKHLYLLVLLTLISSCTQTQKSSPTTTITTAKENTKTISHLARNTQQLSRRFSQLQQGNNDIIRITQFGDSHSAADFFTGKLRNTLQQRYGDAGIGWVSPIYIRGQRHEKITYDSEDFQLLDSRRNDYDGDYPMGGYVAKAKSDMGFIRLKHKHDDDGKWSLKILMKNDSTDDWQITDKVTTLPVDITSQGEGMEIGGVWLTKKSAKGAIVEVIAANGAKNTLWDKWGTDWLQRDLATLSRSDMVILAYGTNEAFNNRLDIQEFEKNITQRVEQIRQALPKAVILVIGAPESYKKRPTKKQLANTDRLSTGLSVMDCESQRPQLLTQIQQIQSDIAKKQNTLYWDWQQAMGGQCQVPQLINNGLMQKDGIHFTSKGYQYAADKLIEYFESIGLIQ